MLSARTSHLWVARIHHPRLICLAHGRMILCRLKPSPVDHYTMHVLAAAGNKAMLVEVGADVELRTTDIRWAALR